MGWSERRRERRATVIGCLCAAVGLTTLLVAGAGGQTVRAGNLIVTVEGGFTPHQLSRTERRS